MAQTLEERLHELEKKVDELAAQRNAETPGKRTWQKTFGLSRDDAGFAEMVELGQDYRRNLGDQNNRAGS
jgi:hypothetical protein